jgi:hypothetical protein
MRTWSTELYSMESWLELEKLKVFLRVILSPLQPRTQGLTYGKDPGWGNTAEKRLRMRQPYL